MEVDKWRRHFTLMSEGKKQSNHKGHYIVEQTQSGEGAQDPEIKFVTPIAQDIELAKSEIKDRTRIKGKSRGNKRVLNKNNPAS